MFSGSLLKTAAGDVEIEQRGSGRPILVLHGSPGGIDAARVMARFLPEDQFLTIMLSRPGYLNTPLDHNDTSIDHEADLLSAVLDILGIDRAGVLAWSGGGPSAYRLAVRHAERVTSVIAIAAVSSRHQESAPSASERFLYGTGAGQWLIRLLARRAPGQIIDGALYSQGSVRGEELKSLVASVMADPEQRSAVLELATTVGTGGSRKAGLENDLVNLAAIDSLELGRIRCPVLLIHGDADSEAPISYSHTAHQAIPNSELVVMEHGTHLAFYAHPDAAAVQAQAIAFFAANV